MNKRILKQYKRQAHRGRQGFGFYLPQSDKLTHSPAEARIKSLLHSVQDSEVLFHHRNPTSTDNVRNACHPFSTKQYFGDRQFVMVHNGWLTNQRALQTAHKALGIEYVSVQLDGRFNDSEALLYDLGLVVSGQQTEVDAEGAIAFVMIERFKGKAVKVHFGRNTSPLNLKQTDNGLSLSSEGPGEAILPHTLYTFEYATGKLTTTPLQLPSWHYETEPYRPPAHQPSRLLLPKRAPHVDNLSGAGFHTLAPAYTEAGLVRLGDSDSFDTAGELLAVHGDYTEALKVAEGRKRRAEHQLLRLNEHLDSAEDAGTAGHNIDEQMEQIMLAEHYEEVIDLLKTWLLEDKTLPKKLKTRTV